jgi:prevent-host-death family protein
MVVGDSVRSRRMSHRLEADMTTVGAYEAKTHFSELLKKVEEGETITVTRHGVPVARIIPIDTSREEGLSAMEILHRYRRERRPTLGGISLRELIEEGRE